MEEPTDWLRSSREFDLRADLPGLSVFRRDGNNVYHTYSTYSRGLHILLDTYKDLDLTPLSRQDNDEGNPKGWIRHHDRHSN